MVKRFEIRFLRVIDANFNRAKEGLRVCEDACRFVFDNQKLTREIKHIRHQITTAMFPLGLKDIVVGRDVTHDIGQHTSRSESQRKSFGDIFYANSQRVKESLRVLEEFAKLKNVKIARIIKTLRYRFYDIEQRVIAKHLSNEK